MLNSCNVQGKGTFQSHDDLTRSLLGILCMLNSASDACMNRPELGQVDPHIAAGLLQSRIDAKPGTFYTEDRLSSSCVVFPRNGMPWINGTSGTTC